MPVRKRRPGRPTLRSSRRQKDRFLAAYRQVGTITAAAAAVGIDRQSHHQWLKKASYRAEFEAAEDEAIEALEKEALHRATVGREETVWFNGQPVGTVRKPSDLLLIFMLKAKRPEVYRERYDARLTANLNVQSAVKVVHEYHDMPTAIDAAYQVDGTVQQPNKLLMSATEAEPVNLAVPVPVPLPDDETNEDE